jgi:transposase
MPLFCGMAFLRVDRKASGNYLYIAESYRREDGTPASRILFHLGKLESYDPIELQKIAARLYCVAGGEIKSLLGEEARELNRYNYGFAQVVKKILCNYGLDNLLKNIARKHQMTIDVYNSTILMLAERLNEPESKRSNYLHQQEYIGLPQLALHELYRVLDKLADYSERIQQHIYQSGRDLFNAQLDVVFYDVTTFYFESDIEHEGALRQKGFSKDGKIGSTQILFGLLIDKNKQPIGYRIYKGDSFEGHTFETALKQLKAQYQIQNIVVVADRGMLSRKNIEITTQQNHYEFILGERLKALPDGLKQYLLTIENYTRTWVYNHQGEQICIRYCTIEHEDRTIICTYSEKRAIKDRKERQEKLEKAQLLIKKPHLLKGKAQHYFLKTDDKISYQLNEERIKQSEKYDGFLAISTNAKQLPVEDVLDNYRHLYQIEHSFRTFKSYLETRPMFHWKDKRIEGHLCLCYMAYAILNRIQLLLARNKTPLSENQIRESISKMQLSHIDQGTHQYYIRSNNTENVTYIIKALQITPLPNIFPTKQIQQVL